MTYLGCDAFETLTPAERRCLYLVQTLGAERAAYVYAALTGRN